MAQWGNTDDAANSVLWATTQVNLPANTTNQSSLFENTTASTFDNNGVAMPVAVGQFGVDANEVQAARAGEGTKAAHAGWVLRTAGTGGRAGRVTNEVLVAMSTMSTDSEDTVFKDYKVRVVTQPANTTANTTASQTATFTVTGATTPAGGTVAYLWYYSTDGGSTYATTAAVSGFSGQNTATLSVNSAIVTSNVLVKAALSAGGSTANSAARTLTITT